MLEEGRGQVGIELVRIDDRLVHGQVIIAWCKALTVERIVVIDDGAAQDIFRKMLLEAAVPPGINIIVLPVSQGIEYLRTAALTGEKQLILTAGPATVLCLLENGIVFHRVSIGGISFGPGKNRIAQAVFVSDADKEAFKKIQQRGVVVQMQILPHDVPLDLMTLLSRQPEG